MKVKQLEWENMNGPRSYWYAESPVGSFSVIERYSAEGVFDAVIRIGDKTIVIEVPDVASGKHEAQVLFETAVLDLLVVE